MSSIMMSTIGECCVSGDLGVDCGGEYLRCSECSVFSHEVCDILYMSVKSGGWMGRPAMF